MSLLRLGVFLIMVASILVLAILGQGQAQTGSTPYSGTVDADLVDIRSLVAGQVMAVEVRVGDHVEAGQVVATMDDRKQRDRVRAAEAELARAKAVLERLRAGARATELALAENDIQAADIQLAQAQLDEARVAELQGRGDMPRAELDRVRTQVALAEARLEGAALRRQLLEEGARKEELQEAEAIVAAVSEQLALARHDVEDATIVAQVSGTVLYRHAEPGEVLGQGGLVLTILPDAPPRLVIYVPEADLAHVAVGAPARVLTDGGLELDGRVAFVKPEAEFTPQNVQTREERTKLVFEVWIEVPQGHGRLHIGMPADAILMGGGGS